MNVVPASVIPAEVVLLVDDDAAVLSSLQFSLELQGYLVHAYASAEALLDEAFLPEQGCLVVDYNLPGLDGVTLLDRLRARGVRLPAVLITTSTPEARARARAAGVPIVEKPLLGDQLLETVRRLLSEERPANGA